MARISTGKNSKQDYGTPKYLFNFFNEIAGGFTLDAAASKENALCKKYFDQDMNGLIHTWAKEKVWLNPPFNDVATWAEKAILEVKDISDHRGRLMQSARCIFLLVNNDCGVKWYETIWNAPCNKIYYQIGHRVKYVGAKDSQSVSSVCICLHPTLAGGKPDRVFKLVNPPRPNFRERVFEQDKLLLRN